MAAEDITVGRLLLAEYERLKEEQKSRIGFRDNLLYVTLAAVVSVLIGTVQTGHTTLLLALPVASCVLGWTYLVNDEKISAIGRYVRTDLGPRLSALAGEQDSLFGWETAHRQDRRRSQRKTIQCAIDLTVFAVAPTTTLAIYWSSGSLTTLPMAVSCMECAAVITLAFQIVIHVDTGA
ncbi:hypothetical protein [Streptomyces phaeochromogenes]|uniref:hypothetical protein n=1 Tax=Streptomyces phaeochromogenes TaxID=1923 RepID=UPI00386D0BF5|nr:hypothetical protein OHB08_00065 [Streptomyces phaeochromogenes]WTA10002.1 hypothetical protein OHB08_51240 [Streptomyces phaeochromogenes]